MRPRALRELGFGHRFPYRGGGGEAEFVSLESYMLERYEIAPYANGPAGNAGASSQSLPTYSAVAAR